MLLLLSSSSYASFSHVTPNLILQIPREQTTRKRPGKSEQARIERSWVLYAGGVGLMDWLRDGFWRMFDGGRERKGLKLEGKRKREAVLGSNGANRERW